MFNVYQWFYFSENYTFPRFQKGSTIFQGGIHHFPGGSTIFQGVQMLISIETHITCNFTGGDTDPLSPPLDPHIIVCSC